uniref:LOC785621 protein n=2 Tax=Bos taurus TaxID=9913 RepID=A5PK91_BOVIN|nr:LOC785621 protein [Bos taurus]
MKRLAGTVLGLLFAQVCCVQGLDVEQSPPALSLQEGASHMLRCNFSASMSNVQWYLQNPSGRLIHLFNIPSGTKQDGRLNATTIPKERRSSLHISSSQTTDSGTYFCAVQPLMDGNYQWIWGSGTKLIIKPEVKDPNPTVYQLRSPQSSDTSVCLFTDFDSNQVNMEKIMGSEGSTVHKTNSTVLNMEILGSKSNGIVTWGNTSDAGCEYTFNETIPFASSLEISCNAKLVEKSFETDINLNSQNLSVIVFRILLLKVVGFNLLMTLRLWSS